MLMRASRTSTWLGTGLGGSPKCNAKALSVGELQGIPKGRKAIVERCLATIWTVIE
jgi:hypothetical protein